jgi:hypothetical protein
MKKRKGRVHLAWAGVALFALVFGFGLGYRAAWLRTEPERIAYKEAQYFRVEITQKIGEADKLIEKMCDLMEQVEKGIGTVNPMVKLYGSDRLVALYSLKGPTEKD